MAFDENTRQAIIDEIEHLPPGESINFNAIQQRAPVLAAEIEDATQRVNAESTLDKNIDPPSSITVGAEDTGTLFAPNSADRQSHLQINSQDFSQKSLEGMRGALEHEAGHPASATSNPSMYGLRTGIAPDGYNYDHEKEYRADRYADATHATTYFLDDTQQDPEAYDKPSADSDHPNHRERISALLSEQYGNSAFGHSGKVSAEDGQFHPNRDKDGVPVTENGSRVTNWDNELAPAIKEQVGRDMQTLDGMVKDGDGFTTEEKAQFQNHIKESVQDFKEENQPEIEPANNQSSAGTDDKRQRLADSFRQDDLADQSITQRNIAEDSRMAQCYAGYHCASQQIDSSGMSDTDKESCKGEVRENIAQGIERDEYPNIQRQETVEANNEQSRSSEPELSLSA